MSVPGPTLGDLLARRAAASGAATAVTASDGEADFAALHRGADRAADAFAALGVGRSDRVGLLLPAGLTFAQAFFGLARLGAVACGLNTRLGAAELAAIGQDSGMSHLVYADAFAEQAAAISAACPDLRAVTRANFAAAMETAPSAPRPPVVPDDLVLLVYTSGTTGRAKGVAITHDQMFWASLTMVPTLDMRPGDVHLLPVPMFHVGGLSFTVHAVHLGMTLLIPPRWDAEEVLGAVERHGVAHFFAVPTMLTGLADAAEARPGSLASVRWAMGGGAPVPTALIGRYDRLGIPLLQTCGATETCGPGLVLDAAHAVARAGSVGRGFFHTEVRLIDETTGEPVAPGTRGEVQLRGRHIARGYWRNPEATAAAFLPDGWFRTGDIGVQDADGFVTLVDRMNNKIITGGENVYPAEVEAVLADLPGVADVAVFGLPDPRWGETVVAAVVPAGGTAPGLTDLKDACAGRLAKYKHPQKLFLREALPRNATGKLDRRSLRAEYEAEGSAMSATPEASAGSGPPDARR